MNFKMKHPSYYTISGLLLFSLALSALLAEPITVAPEYEDRYQSLLNELRCLVCQNQTIAESDADLAKDLRTEVKKMLEEGATDSEIIEFMANRYGDFVLYKPVVKPKTYLLWFGPFFFLALMLIVLYLVIKKQISLQDSELSTEEKEKLNSILDDTKE